MSNSHNQSVLTSYMSHNNSRMVGQYHFFLQPIPSCRAPCTPMLSFRAGGSAAAAVATFTCSSIHARQLCVPKGHPREFCFHQVPFHTLKLPVHDGSSQTHNAASFGVTHVYYACSVLHTYIVCSCFDVKMLYRMEVCNGSGVTEWKCAMEVHRMEACNGRGCNGNVQWMTLPSHHIYNVPMACRHIPEQ